LHRKLRADQLLIDDLAARAVALAKGLSVTGTLNVLVEAADHGFLDLTRVLDRLRKTNFRVSESLLQAIMRRHLEKGRETLE
jgi:predicted nucleic acid-binding protein